MKPDRSAFDHVGLPVADIDDFYDRLPDRYFTLFPREIQVRHLFQLTDLNPQEPIHVHLEQRADGTVDCTVISYDYPFVFSLITGLLASFGVLIKTGEVFTYAPQSYSRSARVNRQSILGALRRRKIVDYFHGELTTSTAFRIWKRELVDQFNQMALGLERNTPESVRDALQLVNRRAAQYLPTITQSANQFLSPIQIEFDNTLPNATELRINTQDTPFFLYSFSTALAHNEISIDRLTINTIGTRVEDTFYLTDKNGHKLEDPALLDQLRLSVMLCKQFTFFLDRAPNPLDAMSRFEQLVQSVLRLPERGEWISLLSNPLALKDMARLLGTSEFLWEDVIRLHYESLLPMLKPHVERQPIYAGESTIESRLRTAVHSASGYEAKKTALNEFKDNEIFLIDLDHILEQSDLLKLSKQLTLLVEAVVRVTLNIVTEELTRRHGVPLTVGNIPAQCAVFGLGKLGGVALGYASDIELLIIYSDSGHTNGESPISNSEFFTELVREIRHFIVAKRSGIFDIDLRLRPYGNDGPLAVSVENFCRYFGNDGSAHLYEKLALVRMRWIAGDAQLGQRVEKLRDEFVYNASQLDFKELWELRRKQFEEKTVSGLVNAKFSPGALVDLEYTVQALQVIGGRSVPELRTPRIRDALIALRKAGVLEVSETHHVVTSYIFLRRLINGLRMLRGSAEDLFLPPAGSPEYDDLARRMGYVSRDHLSASDQLRMEFETVTATIRKFVETHFSRSSLPSQTVANVADIVINPNIPEATRFRILAGIGFKDTQRADVNIRHLATAAENPNHFARLAVLACEWLRQKPDPDMALNNWERFVRQLQNPADHYDILLSQPVRLDILLDVFSVSQYLSDAMTRHPEFFSTVTQAGYLYRPVRRGTLNTELSEISATSDNDGVWKNRLRLFKGRELIRIAIKDVTLKITIPEIYRDISLLAEACLQVALERAWGVISQEWAERLRPWFCLLAMGKLGGSELNYSSDIDLIPIVGGPESRNPDALRELESVLRHVQASITDFTDEGQCYRLDFNLRPFGKAGQWISPVDALIDYYGSAASKWEIQALLKMRPVAGAWHVGFDAIDMIRPVAITRFSPDALISSMKTLRKTAIRKSVQRLGSGIDIKNGEGGIRDVEFLTQALQLLFLDRYPTLWIRSTIPALFALKKRGIISDLAAAQLADIYLLFRRLEHFLQLLDNQQTHIMPSADPELTIAAKRLLGNTANGAELASQVNLYRETVISIGEQYLRSP